MSRHGQKRNSAPHRRRYLIHLFCVREQSKCRYVARIQLWAARMSARPETHERAFTDQCEFVETINRLLPRGSDVRDILSHIESPEGFLYLLHLSSEEAGRLGWQG